MRSPIPKALVEGLVVRPYMLRTWSGEAVADSTRMFCESLERYIAIGIWLRYVRAVGGLMLGTEAVEPRELGGRYVPELERSFARAAMSSLIDYTLPIDPSTGQFTARPAPGLVDAISAYGDDRADAWRDWPTITWRIDRVPVMARRFDFAGAWTAFAIVGAAGIFAYGATGEPDDLDLVSWPTGPAAPGNLVPYQERRIFSRAESHSFDIAFHDHPEPVLPRPNIDRYHPDQLRLLHGGPP